MELVIRFAKYSPAATERIARISVARSRIENATILPAQEAEMRKTSQAESVHYSNQLEGNLLPLIEARRAVSGELAADDRAKLELVNYVKALNLIDALYSEDKLEYSPEILLRIHGVLTQGLGVENTGPGPSFEPRHEGAWRDGVAVVADVLSGQIMHEGEPPESVPGYMSWLCDWLERNRGNAETYPVPVLAGVAHWAVTWIHPFADGNGRMARLLSVMILLREGYLPRRIFSFERYYANDREAYFAALRTVQRHDKSLNAWLEYFLDGLTQEYEQVAERVSSLSLISGHVTPDTQLTSRQEKALTELASRGQTTFVRADYEALAAATKKQAHSDLAFLVTAGVLKLRRRGRSSQYYFARHAAQTLSPNKRVEERIERELRRFLDGRSEWPRVQEWRDAGQTALYKRASDNGGISYWRKRLGH